MAIKNSMNLAEVLPGPNNALARLSRPVR